MEVVIQDYRQVVLFNEVVTASGSATFDGFGSKELNLLINVSGAVTGTTPTLTFTIEEVDAGDQTTVLGNSSTGAAIIATGTQIVALPIMYGGTVKVSWTIGGTGGPTFNGVYASLISKNGGAVTLYGEDGSSVTGTAGTPGTAVLTIQGVSGGQPIPISGTVTATNPSVGTNNAAAPGSSTQIGGTDGTNLQSVHVYDADSGAGTEWVLGVELRKSASGGSVELGTSTDPIRVDPTGTTTQPISGSVTVSSGSVTVSGTVTADQGAPNTLANRWPVIITDGTNTMPTGDVAARAIFQQITDGTNGPVAVKPASTPAVATDPALVVAISPNNPINTAASDVTATGALGALNDTVSVTTPGLQSIGMQLDAGTLVGTIVPEISFDGGTTWVATFFDDPTTGNVVSSIVFGVANTATARTIIGVGGSGMTRVRVSAYTSGTANAHLRASYVRDPTTLHEGSAGSALPPTVDVVGGSDGTLIRAIATDTSGRQIAVGTAATGAAIVGNPVTIGVALDNGLVGALAEGEANRLRVGQESLLWLDTFDGTTINTVRWTQSTSGFVQAQTQTSFDMNSTSVTTANAYSILTSTKSFLLNGEFAIGARVKAKVTAQNDAVEEIGFFTAATNAAPTNGVFMRIDATGNMRLVINFNGTETTSATLGTLTAANYYTFVFYMYGTIARLDILNQDNSVFATTTLQMPVTQAALVQTGHLPIAVRVYNTATPPGAAADIIVSSVSVHQLDMASGTLWEQQVAGLARWANVHPLTGAQLQNNTNNTAPTTITTGALSNTAPSYTTLGGNFAFNTPSGAETDYLLFAFQVPAGFSMYLWGITIDTVILGNQSTTQPTVLQWGIAVGSSAASLATAGANPPIRQSIGLQTAPKSAGVGDILTPAQLVWNPRVPIVCFGGKYVQIFVRVVSGNATANQINRGVVTVDGMIQ